MARLDRPRGKKKFRNDNEEIRKEFIARLCLVLIIISHTKKQFFISRFKLNPEKLFIATRSKKRGLEHEVFCMNTEKLMKVYDYLKDEEPDVLDKPGYQIISRRKKKTPLIKRKQSHFNQQPIEY